MDFKEATDVLFRCCTHAELAEKLGCSVAAIRQARLSPEAAAYRKPPPGWREALRELARQRSLELADLAES